MGSLTFDFLKESFLLNPDYIENSYSSFSDSELQRELDRYRRFCLERQKELREELPTTPHSLNVLSGRTQIAIPELTQRALYVETQLIDDPIFSLTNKPQETTKPARTILGFKDGGLDRPLLASAARYVNELTPMVAANYVKLLPISYFFEPPELTTINFSPDGYETALPHDLLAFFRENSEVQSLKRHGDNWIVLREFIPARGIMVKYREHPSKQNAIYHLFDVQVLSMDKDTRMVRMAQTIPDTPPEPDRFEHWVRSSINQTAWEFHDQLAVELSLAEETNSTYLTTSPFIDKLLRLSSRRASGIPADTARAIIEFNVPFLDRIDPSTLMRIRQEESDAFQNFRVALERGFREVRLEKDPNVAAQKAANVYHELSAAQLEEVKRAVQKAQRTRAADAILATGGLIGATFTSGLSLLASALFGVQAYKANLALKEAQFKPAYFLWRVLK